MNFNNFESPFNKKKNLKERIKAFFTKENLKKNYDEIISVLQQHWKVFLGVVVAAMILMFVVCWTVFFATVRRPEQVMVPNIVGKELTSALLEMQAKELYPKLQLRYTDSPDDAGKVLHQNPEAGAIVKAGRRITITVSRGVILDHIENYVGQNFDEVKINLETMFTGSARPLIVIEEPSYKADESPSGTILAQDPPEGTIISEPVSVKMIVSRGPAYENTKIPSIVGMNVAQVLSVISTSKVIFDFTARPAEKNENGGTVVSQDLSESEYVQNYTRTGAVLALPKKSSDGNVTGVFTAVLNAYPYPVDMMLEYSLNGARMPVVSFRHTGQNVTVPYVVPKGSELILTVAGKTVARQMVE